MKKVITLLTLVLGLIVSVKAQTSIMRYSNVTSIINDRFIGSEPVNATFIYNNYSVGLSYGSKSIVYEELIFIKFCQSYN
jgi:hypothetical protein